MVRTLFTFIGVAFVVPVFCEPITGALIAGGASILGGLLSSYGAGKAGEMSAAAQQEANRMNYEIFETQRADSNKRFNIQNALEKLQMRLYKDQQDFTNEEMIDQKNYNRSMALSNRLVEMSDRGANKGSNLAGMWGAQAQLGGR